ncbi:MAG: prolyl oligopeptidase family serine peptidase [Crocinitomicaceae bacterium]|nr:prolyl oligopeptidase family serine peptidase [Crocinitomicaceae bacterium]MBK8924331.1 prolyl oligopeptidase family serine peptidase [Crocinitomicaceae bacterium]
MRISLILLLIISHAIYAQMPDLKEIMRGNDFIGQQPFNPIWSPDGQTIYFRWQRENNQQPWYYQFNLKEQEIKKLSADQTLHLPVDGFTSFKNQTTVYFQKDHQLFKLQGKELKLILSIFENYYITQLISASKVIIRQNNQLYLIDTELGQWTQLTNFVSGNAPSAKVEESFLLSQQEEIFEVIRRKNEEQENRKKFSDDHSITKPKPVYLEGKYPSFMLLNNLQSHLVYSLDQYPEDAPTHIENYLTEDGYSQSITARPKVGSQNPTHEIYLLNTHTDSCYKIDFSQLTGAHSRPEFLKYYEQENFKAESEKAKDMIIHPHGFNDAGDKFLFEIKSYDNKDRWIAVMDTTSGLITEIDHQHDSTWIGGPGISGWKGEAGNVGWINNSKIYFQSEATGYSHIYIAEQITNTTSQWSTKQLTKGNYEIHDAKLSSDKSKFYITANKNHPGNREFYLLEIATEKMIPVLTQDGYHEVTISPDEKWLAIRYSYKNKPWELYYAPLTENTVMKQITHSTTQEFNAISWIDPEVINFKAKDNTTVYARVYQPEKDKKNNAAVMFVHGAGYLQNAHNYWSHYHREYMFHHLLTQLGYTVIDIDYRASEGYGSKFRTDIYRHMGGKDLSDYIDGRELLIREYGIDSNRVGIYGGSYGGFITLMALLTEPGKFKCGAALRSVTDWAHYNHDYTSNILNTPETDPEAFRKSSPIYFAENLEDRLIMLHGIIDDNVHYQDVVRLSQRFIELGKTNWDLIGYPVEAHAFIEASSWHDEYRRIFEVFEQEIGGSK